MQRKKIILFLFVLILNVILLHDSSKIIENEQSSKDVNKKLSISSIDSSILLDWNLTWGGNYRDAGYDIVLDSSNNSYITGTIDEDDIFLAKFNSTGHYQWHRVFDEGIEADAYGIALDSLNNIYIAGSVESRLLLVKYDSEGNYQWNATRSGISLTYISAYGIILDSSDNIFITGIYEEEIDNPNACLFKFNNMGEYQWNRTMGGSFYDATYGIALDSNNDIYITGIYEEEIDEMDVYLIKYNNIGEFQWNKTLDYNYNDQAIALTIDSSDNIYISGVTTNESNFVNDYDMLLIKIDNSGKLLWNHTYGKKDVSHVIFDVVLDSEGRIYLAGRISNYKSENYEFYLIQFDINGEPLFNHTWGTNNPDECRGITIDSSDSIYIVGKTGSLENSDVYLAKFTITSDSTSDATEPVIPGYNIFLLIGIICVVSVILIKRRNKNKFNYSF